MTTLVQNKAGALWVWEWFSTLTSVVNILLADQSHSTLNDKFSSETSQHCSSTDISAAYCRVDYNIYISIACLVFSLASNLMLHATSQGAFQQIDSDEGPDTLLPNSNDCKDTCRKISRAPLLTNVVLQSIKIGFFIAAVYFSLENTKFFNSDKAKNLDLPGYLVGNEQGIQGISYGNFFLSAVSIIGSVYWSCQNYRKGRAAVSSAAVAAGAFAALPGGPEAAADAPSAGAAGAVVVSLNGPTA